MSTQKKKSKIRLFLEDFISWLAEQNVRAQTYVILFLFSILLILSVFVYSAVCYLLANL